MNVGEFCPGTRKGRLGGSYLHSQVVLSARHEALGRQRAAKRLIWALHHTGTTIVNGAYFFGGCSTVTSAPNGSGVSNLIEESVPNLRYIRNSTSFLISSFPERIRTSARNGSMNLLPEISMVS